MCTCKSLAAHNLPSRQMMSKAQMWRNPFLPVDKRIEVVVSCMSDKEVISQLTGTYEMQLSGSDETATLNVN